MKCPNPKCGARGYCKDTRAVGENKTRRRYHCEKCPSRWSTVEILVHVDRRPPKNGGSGVYILKKLAESQRQEGIEIVRKDIMKALCIDESAHD